MKVRKLLCKMFVQIHFLCSVTVMYIITEKWFYLNYNRRNKFMNKRFKGLLSLILSLIMIISCMTAMYSQAVFADAPTIYIVGDSTGCHYSETTDAGYYYKRVGFGDKLADYLTGGATVENLALSGRSSKSFTSESNYQTLLNNLGSGDILIIAFGHNDEKVENTDLGTEPIGDKNTAGSFKNSLYTNYIQVAQNKGATPVLCSPIVRLPKGSVWTDKDLHKVNGGDYANCAKELATELEIPFIDLTALTKAKYDEVGFTEAANFHAFPNESSIDNTHLNNYGAKMVAYLISTAATGTLSSYIVSSPSAPVKATDLVVNPDYNAPPEGDLTGEDLISSLWTTTSPWYGSAFGAIGGNPNTTNFNISESGNTVRIMAANNKGKISSTADGLAMYYQPVSANENFQIYASAHINSIDNTSDQVGFGAIMADSIKVDTNDATFNIRNYVAASPLEMAKGAVGGFAKINGTISKGSSLSALPKAGDDVNVSIVKNGTSYTVTYGSSVSTYQLTNTQMQGIMYVGLFAARNADITFSNIIYNNEVVEGDVTTQATTELSSETTTIDETSINSFTFWAEDKVGADGKLAVGSYNINGAEINIAGVSSLAEYANGNYENHKAYKIGKYNDEAYAGSVSFTPAADGVATLYMYVPSDKAIYLSETAIGSTATDKQTINADAFPYSFNVTAGKTYYMSTDKTGNFAISGIGFVIAE